MNIGDLPIREIKNLIAEGGDEEFWQAVRNDERKGVQALLKAYEREKKERKRVAGLYKYENECVMRGHELVAGVDEAGRGPLAGPVVVSAVILPLNFFIAGLNDSKKLSKSTREKLYDVILENAVAVNTAVIDEKTIDRINIYQASMNGMYQAVYGLPVRPDEVLIDAVPLDSLEIPHQSIVKGDAKSASIAAASVVAKVTRDRMMNEFDKIYPQYGFARNKGYGTKEHVEALRKYGPCKIHRCSFEPVKSMINF